MIEYNHDRCCLFFRIKYLFIMKYKQVFNKHNTNYNKIQLLNKSKKTNYKNISKMDNQNIINSNNFTITGELSSKGLSLTITTHAIKQRQQIKHPIIYCTCISSLGCLEKLGEWFEDLSQFKEYIKKPQNVELDIDGQLLIIKTRVSSKKSKGVPIAYIPLIVLEQTPKKVLERIIMRCEDEKELNGQEMKNIAKQLAQISDKIIDQNQMKGKYFLGSESENREMVKNLLEMRINDFEKKMIDLQNKFKQISQKQEHKQRQPNQNNDHKIVAEQLQLQQNNQGVIQKNNAQKQLQSIPEQKLTQMLTQLQTKMTTKIMETTAALVNEQQFKVVINKLNYLGTEVQNLQNQSQTLKKQYHKKQKQHQTTNAYLQGDKALKWINPQCKGFPYLRLQGSTVTAKGLSFVFGKGKLVGQTTFRILVKEMDSWIAAGIVDSTYYNRCQVNGLPNIIRYASNGTLLIGQQNAYKGRGFSENQSLTINIDIDNGIIEWKVDEEVRCKVEERRICNKSIQWVGYIYLRRKGDQIVLL